MITKNSNFGYFALLAFLPFLSAHAAETAIPIDGKDKGRFEQIGVTTAALAVDQRAPGTDELVQAFASPPDAVRPWTFWYWFNGSHPDQEGITRDLTAMREQGIKGVLLFPFSNYNSPTWPTLFRHTLDEAKRLGLEIVLNHDAGWSCSLPWMTPELRQKQLIYNVQAIKGGRKVSEKLAAPAIPKDWRGYRDVMVLARPSSPVAPVDPIKIACDMLPSYASGALDNIYLQASGTEVTGAQPPSATLDLTSKMKPDGMLEWEAPPGDWEVIRFGYISNSTHPDFFQRASIDHHLRQKMEPLIAQSGPDIGRTWTQVHQDSYEAGQQTWTDCFPEEFRRRRGYDMIPWMPALADRVVGSSAMTDRFLHDYRQTISDLYVENWFEYFAQRLEGMGLKFSTEGGYGWASAISDGLRIEATAEIPMSEAWNPQRHPVTGKWLNYQFNIHKLDPADPLSLRSIPYGLGLNSVRLASSAAHIYGRAFSSAETFTSYTKDGYDLCNPPYSLKTTADRAFCDGLGRVVFHCYMLQPGNDDKPGRVWDGIGMHFTRNITWWSKARTFTDYLSRCQLLLRQGKFVADFAYWTGDTMPYESPDRKAIRPALPSGCNADLVNTDILIKNMRVENGRLVLPSGMSYRYLVLPPTRNTVDPKSLAKILTLVEAGARVVLGPRPVSAVGLQEYPRSDAEVQSLADRLWGAGPQKPTGRRTVGKGQAIWGMPLSDALKADGVAQDCVTPAGMNDWIHYRADHREIYFLSNQSDDERNAEVTFRVAGMQPELWDPVTGTRRELPVYRGDRETTVVPLSFAPRQSFFVVFSGKAGKVRAEGRNFPELKSVLELVGPWDVTFESKWFYPDNETGGKVRFDQLDDWTKRPEDAVNYFSGTATYRKVFDLPTESNRQRAMYLDLGLVKDIAAVRLNGKDLGVVWCAPWRVEIGGIIKEKENTLEIDVINEWPNRLIGDSRLPAEQRLTKGGDPKVFTPNAALVSSGLIGPVRLIVGDPGK